LRAAQVCFKIRLMACYYFHIHDDEKIIRDKNGSAFETSDLAIAEARVIGHERAVQSAREGQRFSKHGIKVPMKRDFGSPSFRSHSAHLRAAEPHRGKADERKRANEREREASLVEGT
jgi:hypothetical protein